MRLAFAAAQSYTGEPQHWLYLGGPSGCGKTHLVHTQAGQILSQSRVLFYSMNTTLLDQLCNSYHPDKPTTFHDLLETKKKRIPSSSTT